MRFAQHTIITSFDYKTASNMLGCVREGSSTSPLVGRGGCLPTWSAMAFYASKKWHHFAEIVHSTSGFPKYKKWRYASLSSLPKSVSFSVYQVGIFSVDAYNEPKPSETEITNALLAEKLGLDVEYQTVKYRDHFTKLIVRVSWYGVDIVNPKDHKVTFLPMHLIRCGSLGSERGDVVTISAMDCSQDKIVYYSFLCKRPETAATVVSFLETSFCVAELDSCGEFALQCYDNESLDIRNE